MAIKLKILIFLLIIIIISVKTILTYNVNNNNCNNIDQVSVNDHSKDYNTNQNNNCESNSDDDHNNNQKYFKEEIVYFSKHLKINNNNNIFGNNSQLIENSNKMDDHDGDDDKLININQNENHRKKIRYDGYQLLRLIHKQETNNNSLKDVIRYLETNYNISLWNEINYDFIDFLVPKFNKIHVKNYLKNFKNIQYKVLIDNIQNLIDKETEAAASQNRLKRSIITQQQRTNETLSKDDTGTGFMSWNQYHGLKDIYGMLKHFNRTKSKLCKLFVIGKSNENRNLFVLRISNNNPKNKDIWIDGGIHAREWISPAAVTYIIYHLIDNWDQLPSYLKNITWYFMPMVNPDGYEYSRKYNRLWRKNRRKNSQYYNNNNNANVNFNACDGVDLNRNFDIEWNLKTPSSSNNPCSETYKGIKPFSEPESQAIRNFLLKIRSSLKSYITIHSYGQYILYPWAYTDATKPKDYKRMRDYGNECAKSAKEISGKIYKVLPAYTLGIAGGGSDDWSKKQLNLDYVYTIELRDQGEYGFLLPLEQIYVTCREALKIIKTLGKFI